MGSRREMNIDTVYYRDGLNNSVSRKILKIARENVFKDFMELMRPNHKTTILDIGVSNEENESSNFLEKMYPWKGNITCCGLGDGNEVKKSFPEITFKAIAKGEHLPFEDHFFDISYSNAVLEHVGSFEKRLFFISEHLRVAKKVFIVIPNRWFPVEHHTSIPLLHFSPYIFRLITSLSKFSYWSDPENLDFLGKAEIVKNWPEQMIPNFKYSGVGLAFMSSNLIIYKNQKIN